MAADIGLEWLRTIGNTVNLLEGINLPLVKECLSLCLVTVE